MILVDSSVWIDYFRGAITAQTDCLDALLGAEPVLMGDLILVEVLQGLSNERDVRQVRQFLAPLETIELCGADIAVQAAQHCRQLRTLGITVRKTIDTVIATCCIARGHTLLHDNRDFDAFAEHLGLRTIAAAA